MESSSNLNTSLVVASGEKERAVLDKGHEEGLPGSADSLFLDLPLVMRYVG